MNVDDLFSGDLESLNAMMAEFSATQSRTVPIAAPIVPISTTPIGPISVAPLSAPLEGRRARPPSSNVSTTVAIAPRVVPQAAPKQSARMPWEDDEDEAEEHKNINNRNTRHDAHVGHGRSGPGPLPSPSLVSVPVSARGVDWLSADPIEPDTAAVHSAALSDVRSSLSAVSSELTALRSAIAAAELRAEEELLELEARGAAHQLALTEGAEAVAAELERHAAQHREEIALLHLRDNNDKASALERNERRRSEAIAAAKGKYTERLAVAVRAVEEARERVSALKKQRELMLRDRPFDADAVRAAIAIAGENNNNSNNINNNNNMNIMNRNDDHDKSGVDAQVAAAARIVCNRYSAALHSLACRVAGFVRCETRAAASSTRAQSQSAVLSAALTRKAATAEFLREHISRQCAHFSARAEAKAMRCNALQERRRMVSESLRTSAQQRTLAALHSAAAQSDAAAERLSQRLAQSAEAARDRAVKTFAADAAAAFTQRNARVAQCAAQCAEHSRERAAECDSARERTRAMRELRLSQRCATAAEATSATAAHKERVTALTDAVALLRRSLSQFISQSQSQSQSSSEFISPSQPPLCEAPGERRAAIAALLSDAAARLSATDALRLRCAALRQNAADAVGAVVRSALEGRAAITAQQSAAEATRLAWTRGALLPTLSERGSVTRDSAAAALGLEALAWAARVVAECAAESQKARAVRAESSESAKRAALGLRDAIRATARQWDALAAQWGRAAERRDAAARKECAAAAEGARVDAARVELRRCQAVLDRRRAELERTRAAQRAVSAVGTAVGTVGGGGWDVFEEMHGSYRERGRRRTAVVTGQTC